MASERNFTGVDPIRALLWSADINCVIAATMLIGVTVGALFATL